MENKENKYEGFSLAMALVDAIPVLCFGAGCIILGLRFGSPLFIIGAALCFLGGLLKVTWKLVLALASKDVKLLNRQFRYTMLIGFALIILSVILGRSRISFASILAAVTGMPACIFFLLWLAGMVTMIVLAKKLDSSIAKNNWIEQCVNAAAQLSLLLGLIFI